MAAALAVGAARAQAQTYPLSTGAITASGGTLAPGGTVTISAGGYAPGSAVSLDVFSAGINVGTAKANAAGSFTDTVTIPSDLSAGEHSLEATGTAPGGGTRITSITFFVSSESAESEGGTPASFILPITGQPLFQVALLGGLALIMGAGTLVAARRRRSRS